MHVFSKSPSKTLARGEWMAVNTSEGKKAKIMCPRCGMKGTLYDHDIDARGRVTPSAVCSGCEFHEYITLEGWSSSND